MSRIAHRVATISCVVLFAAGAIIAQTPAKPDSAANEISTQISPQPEVYRVPSPATAGCPVSMRAQHGSGGGLVMTSRQPSGPDAQSGPDGRSLGDGHSGIEQRIHLILGKVNGLDKGKDSARVVAATVTVRGVNGKWLTMPASSSQLGSSSVESSLVKKVDVKFGITAGQEEFADLVLPGFSSVQSITLNSLTYADGSIWNSFDGKACRVSPDPFMLVSMK